MGHPVVRRFCLVSLYTASLTLVQVQSNFIQTWLTVKYVYLMLFYFRLEILRHFLSIFPTQCTATTLGINSRRVNQNEFSSAIMNCSPLKNCKKSTAARSVWLVSFLDLRTAKIVPFFAKEVRICKYGVFVTHLEV